MVSVSYADGDEIRLILRPDQSLSWRGNKFLFLFFVVWLTGFAMLFVARGAWMVLPFVGLELAALGAALYCVSRKLSHQQVLDIGSHHVTITEGRQRPEHSHTFDRNELVIHVAPPAHPWDRPVIVLRARGGARQDPAIRLGEFLNREDCQQMLQLLGGARLATRRGLGGTDLVC